MSSLPHPNDLQSIKNLVTQIDERTKTTFENWKGFCPEAIFFQKFKLSKISLTSKDGLDLTMHSLARANNQVNEACNKIWTTIELLSIENKTKVCPSFYTLFSGGNIIPTLYYAQAAALISILSVFGIISYRENKNSYNITRTRDGWEFRERTNYIKQVLESDERSWHSQILTMYEKLAEKGIQLPEINLKNTKKLQQERNRYHYDILSQTAMDGNAIDTYFDHLGTVMETTNKAIKTIQEVWKITNKCDQRYQELTNAAIQLHSNYNKELNVIQQQKR